MYDEMNPARMQNLAEAIKTPEGQAKFAQEAGDYIFTEVRDTSFRDQILPPQPVATSDLRAGNTEGTSTAVPGTLVDDVEDSLYIVKEVEVAGKAMVVSLRGQPTANYINGKRFVVPMHTVTTERFEKTQDELLATKYDLIKVVEDTAFLETHTERDRTFLQYCQLAVDETGKEIEVSGPLQRSAFSRLTHPVLSSKIIPTKVLMSYIAATDMDLWDQTDLGDMVAEVTTKGYTAAKVMGLTHVRSIKSDLFDTMEGNDIEKSEMWAFPEPRFLGYNVYCGDYRVWSSWEGRLWRFEGSQTVGLGFGNINGIVKITINY